MRGGGIPVDDSLARQGWQGSDPVIATLLTCNIESGAILGAWYETRGALKDMTFKAEELWPGALKGATVTIKFEDLCRRLERRGRQQEPVAVARRHRHGREDRQGGRHHH